MVEAYEDGASAEGIAWRYPAASLGQVHAAIAYYLSGQEDVQAYMANIQSPDIDPAERLVNALRQKLDKRYQVQVTGKRIRINTPSS